MIGGRRVGSRAARSLQLAVALLTVSLAVPMAGCGNASTAPVSRPVFSDQFNAGSLDTQKWATCYPWARDTGCTNLGNQELEWYTPGQVSVDAGELRLTEQRSAVTGADAHGKARLFPYRSGMVTTAGRFEFTYGYVEFRASAPVGRGLWPSLWLLPANQTWPPEVDVMEALGNDPTQIVATYHRTPSDAPGASVKVSNISGWHTYAVDWQPDSLTWYVDHREVFSVRGGVPSQPMYLLANLAVDGRPEQGPDSTTPAAASLIIDHVFVWQSL